MPYRGMQDIGDAAADCVQSHSESGSGYHAPSARYQVDKHTMGNNYHEKKYDRTTKSHLATEESLPLCFTSVPPGSMLLMRL